MIAFVFRSFSVSWEVTTKQLEVFLGNGMLSAWTSAKVRERYNETEQEDEDQQSVVQGILWKSTDFLRLFIVPVEGHVCPSLPPMPAGIFHLVGIFRTRKETMQLWCVACGGRCSWKASSRCAARVATTSSMR